MYCDSAGIYACSRSDCDNGQVGRLNAADIQIRDFERSGLGLVAQTVTVTATSTADASPTAAATQSVRPNHCSSDSGKLAGVGVGVGVPLLLAFLTTLYMLRRSLRRQRGMVMAQDREQSVLKAGPVKAQDNKPPLELPENVTNVELPPHVMAHEMSNGRTDQRPS